MPIHTLDQIKNAIGLGVRPNLFEVQFATGPAEAARISILCKGAALPGSTVGIIEVPQIGGRRYKLAGDRTFAEWTTTVLNDRDFRTRTALENYQKLFVGTDFGSTRFGNRSSTLSTVTVRQLGQKNESIRTYRLQNCFISDISTIDLSYDSTDAIEEFTVTWVYDYFTVS
jgi:hypothetical protein